VTITINGFDQASIANAIKELETERARQRKTISDMCVDLATSAATQVSLEYARTPYDGPKDYSVTVRPMVDGAQLIASGQTVMFLEYGAGAKYGYGYPDMTPFVPGSYNPMSDNWKDPNGWFYAHGQRSWGNPPSAAMYHAKQAIKDMARDYYGAKV
jgi:hypothetical protein